MNRAPAVDRKVDLLGAHDRAGADEQLRVGCHAAQ